MYCAVLGGLRPNVKACIVKSAGSHLRGHMLTAALPLQGPKKHSSAHADSQLLEITGVAAVVGTLGGVPGLGGASWACQAWGGSRGTLGEGACLGGTAGTRTWSAQDLALAWICCSAASLMLRIGASLDMVRRGSDSVLSCTGARPGHVAAQDGNSGPSAGPCPGQDARSAGSWCMQSGKQEKVAGSEHSSPKKNKKKKKKKRDGYSPLALRVEACLAASSWEGAFLVGAGSSGVLQHRHQN